MSVEKREEEPIAEESLEEKVRERLPWWMRELLRIRDRVQAEAGEEAPRKYR